MVAVSMLRPGWRWSGSWSAPCVAPPPPPPPLSSLPRDHTSPFAKAAALALKESPAPTPTAEPDGGHPQREGEAEPEVDGRPIPIGDDKVFLYDKPPCQARLPPAPA